MNNKKTLVIHPDDRSTDFLKLIYKDKGYTVLNFNELGADGRMILASNPDYCTALARKYIEEYDKIILMGHGTPGGLLNPKVGGYIIDDSFADLLNEKEVVSIWCFSDQFFKKNNIFNNQFHTGMIISEVLEQLYVLGRVYLDYSEQLDNMNNFGRIVGECIEMEPKDMQKYILDNYVGDDEVTRFNRKNILVF